jgi:taurine dioxygenase
MSEGFDIEPLPGASFGGLVRFAGGARAALAALQAAPESLPQALYARHGLLVLKGMGEINDEPALLVELSRPFGPEVENYHETPTPKNMIHQSVDEILVISNIPPCEMRPPPQPAPPRTADGALPVQFPHRRGWHTDQSFRRPPPDISLFYAAIPAPRGQGQTLYADGIGAYDALPDDMKARIEDLEGIHVVPGTGRSEPDVRAGEAARPLPPHEAPRRQPVVRVHPVTGQRALYLCEAGQMDWRSGPLAGLAPGPDGDGAKLLYALMSHYTRPEFTYVHDWDAGDIVIYDNRSTAHAATWFDADAYQRLMWRTTIRGNPGPEYAGETPSWIPADH